jgi:3-oxoacyl-[acyl-carrier protein] reductase
VAVDVADADGVQAAVDRVAAELGGPTVLVNNAGVTRTTCCSRCPSRSGTR